MCSSKARYSAGPLEKVVFLHRSQLYWIISDEAKVQEFTMIRSCVEKMVLYDSSVLLPVHITPFLHMMSVLRC